MEYKYYELSVNFDPYGYQPKYRYDKGDIFTVNFYVLQEDVNSVKGMIDSHIKELNPDNLPYCIETFGKERAPYISSKESIIKELDESIPYLIDEVKVNPILSPDDYNDGKRM